MFFKKNNASFLLPISSNSYPVGAGYIDLSRRYIEPEDREKCVERYNKVM